MHAIIHSRNKFVCLWCIQKDWNFSCLLQVSIPCKKKCYRLYGKEGYPLVDIMTGEDEPSPKVNNIHGNTYKQWACIKECLHFETLGYQTCTISSLGSDVSAIVIVLWNLKQLVGCHFSFFYRLAKGCCVVTLLMNQREHMLFHSMLRNYWSATGLEIHVWTPTWVTSA